jgi:hypothetical protein
MGMRLWINSTTDIGRQHYMDITTQFPAGI